jgi:hypothetical protein
LICFAKTGNPFCCSLQVHSVNILLFTTWFLILQVLDITTGLMDAQSQVVYWS